jgi:hypothetical protein
MFVHNIYIYIHITGVITLFDGQKQYPLAKVGVDFLFVEHLQFDCIEIIGMYVCMYE